MPPDLTALLFAGPGSPEGCTRVGSVDVARRLMDYPVEDSAGLLAIPRETWFGDNGKCFVRGCSTALRDRLEAHLRARFGVRLGDLAAEPEPTQRGRGPPRAAQPSIADLYRRTEPEPTFDLDLETTT